MVVLETLLFGSALVWYQGNKKLKKAQRTRERLAAVLVQVQQSSMARQDRERENRLAIEGLQRRVLEKRIAIQEYDQSALESRIKQANERTDRLQKELDDLKKQMSKMMFSSPATTRSGKSATSPEKEGVRPKTRKVEKENVRPRDTAGKEQTGSTDKMPEKEKAKAEKSWVQKMMEAKNAGGTTAASGSSSRQRRPNRGVPIGGSQRRPKYRPPLGRSDRAWNFTQ